MRTHLRRSAIAGLVGGLAYGIFVVVMAGPMIATAETFEHNHAESAAHGGGDTLGTVASLAGGVLWGALLAIVFLGIVYYFFEPAIPGPDWAKSHVVAGAGFITISGAPWLVFPPQPPGVEPALDTSTRIALYAGMMVAGAVACLLAGLLYKRVKPLMGQGPALAGVALPFLALFGLSVLLSPPAPTSEVPQTFARAFTTMVVTGQVGLWLLLAATYNRLRSSTDLRAPATATAD